MKRANPLRAVKPDRPVLMLFVIILSLFAVYEIAATIFVLLNAQRERTRTRASILILVAATLSAFYPVLHYVLSTILARIRRGNGLKSFLRPFAIVYLSLLFSLWVAASFASFNRAFEVAVCASLHAKGIYNASVCTLEKYNAIGALITACLVLAILLLVTCSTQLFLPSTQQRFEKTFFGTQRLPLHRNYPSTARSFSESQTLRPSHDTEDENFKLAAPGALSYSQGPYGPLLPPIHLQKASPGHHAFKPQLQIPYDVSQTNLLPSPLAPLPPRPDRTTSMRSHPPLIRSKTADTISSSIYSRSVSTESLFSPQLSPLNLSNDDPFSRILSPTTAPSTIAHKPPTIRQVRDDTISSDDDIPARPASKPAMPPAAFWLYARTKQQDKQPPIHKASNSAPNPISTASLRTSRSPSHHLRKASISRTNTLLAHAFCDTSSSKNFSHPLPTPPSSPSPSPISISSPIPIPPIPPAAEEEASKFSKALKLKRQGSYERLRKGVWAGGKQDLYRSRSGDLAASGEGRIKFEDAGAESMHELGNGIARGKGKARDAGEEEREARKVVRIRRPSGAF